MNIVFHVVYLVGAICLAAFPYDRSRQRASWARWLFFGAAFSALILAADGLIVDLRVSLPIWAACVRGLVSMIRGFALGLLFALIVSGELSGKVVKQEVAA